MQFTEPYITWDGSDIKTGPYSAVMLNKGDWTYYTPKTEIVAGDSVFGLNDMTFPIVRMTGVRYNGMLGFPEEKDLWLRSPGSAGSYVPPQVFTGQAPAGSKVELIINDRSIETQEVLFDKYRFENIRLAPGSLNAVRIIITEPGGYQKVIEQNMYGKKVHLPRGGLGFISGMGTNRTVDDWTSQGLFGGGRVFYGATDTLTLSTTLAAQNNFYLPISNLTTDAFGVLQRGYPLSSGHIGAQAVWLPQEYFLFSPAM